MLTQNGTLLTLLIMSFTVSLIVVGFVCLFWVFLCFGGVFLVFIFGFGFVVVGVLFLCLGFFSLHATAVLLNGVREFSICFHCLE